MLPSKMVPFLVTIAFSCARAKTIQKRNVWTRIFLKRRKNLRFQTNLWTWPQCYFVASKSCSKWTLTKSGLEQTEWDSQPRSELMTQTQSTGWQRGFPWRVMGPKLSAWCVIMPKLAAWAVIGHSSVMREIGLPLVSLPPCWLTRIPLGPVTWLRTKTTLRVDFHCRLIFPCERT